MEAGSSSHYWARRLQGLGHRVKLMAPQFVRPYVKTNKNDARDAEAICEAGTRPSMRFVPLKTAEQQAMLALPRARQGFVKARTAQAHQLRSLLAACRAAIRPCSSTQGVAWQPGASRYSTTSARAGVKSGRRYARSNSQ
jgi:transposase